MGTNYQNHRRSSEIANQKIIGKSAFFHKKCSFLRYLTEMLTSRDGGDGDGILKKSADVQTRTSIHKEQQDTFGDFDQQNTKKTQVVSSKDAFFCWNKSLLSPKFSDSVFVGKK